MPGGLETEVPRRAELDADHHALAAYLAHELAVGEAPAQPLDQPLAEIGRSLDQPLLVQRGERRQA
jgi:hypothetical protein